MGVQFDFCNASWSYGDFNDFRRRLASEIGLVLNEMEAFAYGFERQHPGERHPNKPWSAVSDPIVPLLHHSDCEGELSPEECAQVAPRLRELVAAWPETDYDRKMALELAKGMDEAVADGTALQFL